MTIGVILMAYKLNRKYYKSLNFYFGIVALILWIFSVLNPLSFIDFLISAAFLIYSIYALCKSLIIKK